VNVAGLLLARGVKREDLSVLKVSDIGVRIYGNGLMVSNKMIAENPKAVAAFVRALNRSFRESLADPAASVKALKARDPLVDEKVEQERFTLLMPAILTPRTRTSGIGGIDKATLEKQIEYVNASVHMKTVPAADALFNSSFLPPQAERMPLK